MSPPSMCAVQPVLRNGNPAHRISRVRPMHPIRPRNQRDAASVPPRCRRGGQAGSQCFAKLETPERSPTPVGPMSPPAVLGFPQPGLRLPLANQCALGETRCASGLSRDAFLSGMGCHGCTRHRRTKAPPAPRAKMSKGGSVGCVTVCVCVCVCWLSGYLARFWRGGRGDMLALARAGRPTVAWMDPVG